MQILIYFLVERVERMWPHHTLRVTVPFASNQHKSGPCSINLLAFFLKSNYHPWRPVRRRKLDLALMFLFITRGKCQISLNTAEGEGENSSKESQKSPRAAKMSVKPLSDPDLGLVSVMPFNLAFHYGIRMWVGHQILTAVVDEHRD